MNSIEAFFFDLDGTLVDTYEADFLAYRDAIKEVTGHEVFWEDFRAQHGKEIRQKLAILLPGLLEDQVKSIALNKRERYPRYLHLTKPNKPLIGFLRQQAAHYPTALVTTAKQANVDAVVSAHELENLFTAIVTGDDVHHAKPHPEPYLCALQKTHMSAENVIAFEDSQTGIDSAVAAAIKVVRVRNFA